MTHTSTERICLIDRPSCKYTDSIITALTRTDYVHIGITLVGSSHDSTGGGMKAERLEQYREEKEGDPDELEIANSQED